MFYILDGREHFYQWDIDRQIVIADKTIKEVHFANKESDMALVVNAYSLNGKWIVDVPNSLLQSNLSIVVYGYDKDYTKYEKKFKVKGRAKPDDYVYTDVEVNRWVELEERIDQIEENGVSDEKIAEAVTEYLNENPIESPVTQVNGKTGDVVLTAKDVGALPDDTVIPSTVGLATEEYVNDAIAAIDIPEVDLSNYYTKTQTDSKIATALTPYVKSTTLATVATSGDYKDLKNKPTIPTVPTKVSAFTNDAGYLTEHQSLDNYYNKSEVDTKIAEAQLGGGEVNLDNYYTKEETDALIPSIAGLATETYVNEAIAAIEIPETDLSNYYNKQEVDAKIPDTSGFLTEVPAEYITETELNEALENISTGGGSVAVDGKTIIQNADGTISTAVGGYETKVEQVAGYAGSFGTGETLTVDMSDIEDAYSDMGGESATIIYTIDGEEYEEEYDIDVNTKNNIIIFENAKAELSVVEAHIEEGYFTIEFTGNKLTEIKFMSVGGISPINPNFIPVGIGLKKTASDIRIDNRYIENLIATYIEDNITNAEEASY